MRMVDAPHELPQINCKLHVGVEQGTLDKNKPSSRKACFSFAAYAKNVINHLRKCHIPIAEGLSDEEVCSVESTFGFTFPPDLLSILQEGLPIGTRFPQWRAGSHAEIKNLLNLPIAALCNEVCSGRFWPSEWGARPDRMVDAVRVAACELERVPTLVPVYASCYISCFPVLAGNPVFLVQKSTILYCGYDLADFFKRQAFVPRAELPKNSLVFEPHLGLGTMKDQIKAQKNAEVRGNTEWHKLASKGLSEESAKDHIAIDFSKPKWRWADESPRMPTDLLTHVQAYAKYHYSHVKEVSTSPLITPSPPPPTPSPSPSFSSSSSSSPPSSKRNSDSDTNSTASSSSSSSSSSERGTHEDHRVGLICKKYLYFHEQQLPSRMLNKFTMPAPPWAATQARKIDFWSDMAENHWLRPPMSYPGTPRTPHRLHAADNADDHQQPTKQCGSNPTLQAEHSDQLSYRIYEQPAKPSSNFALIQKNSSYKHDYNLDSQPAEPCDASSANHPLQSISKNNYAPNYLNDLTDGPSFEPMYADSHDYIIKNQPTKRCRSSLHSDSEQICSFPAANQSNIKPIAAPNHRCKDHQHQASCCNESSKETEAYQLQKMVACTQDQKNSSTWLSTYLNGLADTLRWGKWGEADINDMLLQSKSNHAASCNHPYIHNTDTARLQRYLHQAGWSHQETLQMM